MLIPFKQILQDYNLKPKGILHIGAYDGAEMHDYAAEGITNVIFIEAQESIFPTLLGRIYNYPQAKAILACVSDVDGGEIEFLVTNNGQSSSILELGEHANLYPDIVVTERIKMTTITIKSLFEHENLILADYDFVNIDIQGAELKAIKGMGDISHVKAFYLEVNKKETYKGCALIWEIDDYLSARGFELVLSADWRGDAWTDALYLRK